MIDAALEVLESLSRHGMRTVLTLLSVAWGTFVLVVLLGAGEGLSNTASHEFRDDAVNSLWIYRGMTSRPFDGLPVGRQVQFDNTDLPFLRGRVPEIDHLTGRFYTWGGQKVSAGTRSSEFDIRSVHPDHRFLENTRVVKGRYLDDLDIAEQRKVAVIGKPVEEFLFRGDDAMGQWIAVGGVQFRVVGVFDDEGGEDETRMVYLPISTAQAAFGGYDRVHQIMFTIGDASVEESLRIQQEVTEVLAARKRFDPADPRAMRVRNNVEGFAEIQRILSLLEAFVWLVGLGTMTAGLVGVSNILLVTVRERTNEIGLRKALGARPSWIVGSIVSEAVLLTGVAGYLGIVGGVSVIATIKAVFPDNEYIRDPTVRVGPALVAAALLVVAGAVAGAAPAIRAATIRPVEALRDGAA